MADDDKKIKIGFDGITIGDQKIQPVPAFATTDRRDYWRNDERQRQLEEDKRAAQASGLESSHGFVNPLAPTFTPPDPATELDEAIARARTDLPAAPGGGEVPIFLRDPITGAVIEHKK